MKPFWTSGRGLSGAPGFYDFNLHSGTMER